MAFEYCTAYRYATGEVEGFVGTALSSEERAKADAIRKIRDKIQVIQDTRREPAEPNFDESRMITSHDGVKSDYEHQQIQRDWDVSRKSRSV